MGRLAAAATALVVIACSTPHDRATASPPREAAPAAAPAAVPVAVVCCAEPAAVREQPPEVKLKLGHYRNARRGIGLVFDRTTAQAKLRFDGTNEIIKVDGQPGAYGRIDYIRRVGQVVLQLWSDGRVVVFLAGAEDGIEVRRDGDADPL